MKKNIDELFDELPADELEKLIEENPAPTPDDLSALKEKVRAKTGLKKKSRFSWQPLVASAACLCLILGEVALSGLNGIPAPPDPGPTATGGSTTDILIDANRKNISDLLGRTDFDDILWASDASQEDTSSDDANTSQSDATLSNSPSISTVWNNIALSQALYAQMDGENTLAICVRSKRTKESALGQDASYQQLTEAANTAAETYEIMKTLEFYAEQWEIGNLSSDSALWKQFCSFCDSELVWQYADLVAQYYDGESFDTEAIVSNAQKALEESERLEEERRLYRVNFTYGTNVPDLSLLNSQFYVVENDGVQVVILNATELEALAQAAVEIYSEDQLKDNCFCLADKSALGLEDDVIGWDGYNDVETPSDDGADNDSIEELE